MDRRFLPALPSLLIAVLAAASIGPGPASVDAAGSKASSRIRDLAGRIEVQVATTDETLLMDSLEAAAARQGYELITRDVEDARLRFEKPATAAEVAVHGWSYEGTERKRIDVEIVQVKGRADRLAVVAAVTLVRNPSGIGEQVADRGKRQPDRDALKALLASVKPL
jgi:hypothetical protein